MTTCKNKTWGADKLEALVWHEMERVLDNPELIISEFEKQRHDANRLGVLETELRQLERQLKTLDREQEKLLSWALKGFPEETVIMENKKINGKRESLKAQKTELEIKIMTSQEASINSIKLESFIELIRRFTSDFESKRQVLEMLGINIWLDGKNVEITGTIPTDDGVIANMPSTL